MALTGDQMKQLNSFLSREKIRKTAASVFPKFKANAPLGSLTEALGIVPKEQEKQFRQNCKAVPAPIAKALTQALHTHLDAVNKSKSDGPQEVRVRIKTGSNFGLQITQLDTHVEITLTMQTGKGGT